jgi:hypothetical protein
VSYNEAVRDGDRNTAEVQRGHVHMRLWETENGGVRMRIFHKGVTDEIVIPKRNRLHYADVFELAAMAIKTWSKR